MWRLRGQPRTLTVAIPVIGVHPGHVDCVIVIRNCEAGDSGSFDHSPE